MAGARFLVVTIPALFHHGQEFKLMISGMKNLLHLHCSIFAGFSSVNAFLSIMDVVVYSI